MSEPFSTWGTVPSVQPSPEAVRRQEEDAALDRVIGLGQQAEWEDEIETTVLPDLQAKYRDIALDRDDLKPATLTRYANSFRVFSGYCNELNVSSLPARAVFVAGFLDEQITRGAAAATIRRLVAAISYGHRINDFPDPTEAHLVKAIIRFTTIAEKHKANGKHKLNGSKPNGSEAH
jgi:hypothetical protein